MKNPVIEALKIATPQQVQEAHKEELALFAPFGINTFKQLHESYCELHAFRTERKKLEESEKKEKEIKEGRAKALKLLTDAKVRAFNGNELTEDSAIVTSYMKLESEDEKKKFIAEHVGTIASSKIAEGSATTQKDEKANKLAESIITSMKKSANLQVKE